MGDNLCNNLALKGLADCIRTKLVDSPLSGYDVAWATDFHVLHTVHGIKKASVHQTSKVSTEFSFADFLLDTGFDSDILPYVADWFIDVSVEIRSELGECLQWSTPGHRQVILNALRVSDDIAEKIVDGRASKYARDHTMHLTALSGFRVAPCLSAQGQYRAVYIQGSTTDNAAVQHLESEYDSLPCITTEEAMLPDHPTRTIERMCTAYDDALNANSSSNARLMVRVPFPFATSVLTELEPDTFKDSLCSFTPHEWW